MTRRAAHCEGCGAVKRSVLWAEIPGEGARRLCAECVAKWYGGP